MVLVGKSDEDQALPEVTCLIQPVDPVAQVARQAPGTSLGDPWVKELVVDPWVKVPVVDPQQVR